MSGARARLLQRGLGLRRCRTRSSVGSFLKQFSTVLQCDTIDLRSDTVTQPSFKMRERMLTAEVGDDVFGEDPTVQALEGEAADLMGKEAALFMPSGCMANLVAIGVHCGRGDELLCGRDSHVFLWEAGSASAFLGVSYMCLPNSLDGTINSTDIKQGIRHKDPHCPTSRLLCLENTHNMCGGAAIPPATMLEMCEAGRSCGLKVHIDGARIMNAAVALGVSAKELVSGADTVSFCLSKGLGAPAGSLLCGSGEVIARARYLRKALGGGMRQSGVLAAAGLEGLNNNIDRLAIDHSNAKLFAEGLAAMEGIKVDLAAVQTNMVYFSIDVPALKGMKGTTKEAGLRVGLSTEADNKAGTSRSTAKEGGGKVAKDSSDEKGKAEAVMIMEGILKQLAARGVLLGSGYGSGGVLCRAVTHLDVSTEQVETALSIVEQVMHEAKRRLTV